MTVLYPDSHEARPPVITLGRITTAAVLDREEMGSYSLDIIAMDTSGFPLNATASVVVEVLDRNDNRPQFAEANFTFPITENTFVEGSTLIGQFPVSFAKIHWL